MTVAEVVIYDADAESIKDLFLPPPGTHCTADELQLACARLAEATRAIKRLRKTNDALGIGGELR